MATAALIGAAGVTAAGGIASSVATNQGNKNIAQQNNAFNEKMFDKQVAYNKEMYQQQLGDQWKFYNDAKQNSWDMFNAANEYNSASAQRQRLEAAGLNPYLMMSGGSAGTASTGSGVSGSAPSAQGVSSPTATPYSADYSGIAQGIGTAIDQALSQPDRNLKQAQADNLRIEGKYIAGKAIADILNVRENTKTMKGRLALDKFIASIDADLKSSQMAVNSENIAKLRNETKFTALQTMIANQQLNFLPMQQKMELAQKASEIKLKAAQTNMSKQQLESEIHRTSQEYVKFLQGMQDYQFNSDSYNDRLKTIKETLWNIMHDSDSAGLGKFVGRVIRPLYE